MAPSIVIEWFGLLWPDHHHHLAAFQPRHGFDLAHFGDIRGHTVQQLKPQILVRHLTAAEAQGDLDLVTFAEEFKNRTHLHVIVMDIGSGAELDFLDLDDVLLLAGLGLALLVLVFELADVLYVKT